jgi:hypothetical protein
VVMILTKFGYEANKHPSSKGDAAKKEKFRQAQKPSNGGGSGGGKNAATASGGGGGGKKLPPNVKAKKIFVEKV